MELIQLRLQNLTLPASSSNRSQADQIHQLQPKTYPIVKNQLLNRETRICTSHSYVSSTTSAGRNSEGRVDIGSLSSNNVKIRSRGSVRIVSALVETAASVAVAATVVGAAATYLIRRTKSSQVTENPTKPCEDCGGSGVCSECNGEGFVLKKMSQESADRARLMAKNAATRYTAGLPKKWSYCTKCSSARSCTTCDGTGKLSYIN